MLKKISFVVLVAAFALNFAGCKKKAQDELAGEQISMDTLANLNTTAEPKAVSQPLSSTEVKASVLAPAETAAEPKLDKLPPSGPYKPTNIEIQTALKNAGFYTGKVDGSLGKMSKKSVEEFQKANGLKADGKVGPKTWDALKKYLTAAVADATLAGEKAPAKKR